MESRFAEMISHYYTRILGAQLDATRVLEKEKKVKKKKRAKSNRMSQ